MNRLRIIAAVALGAAVVAVGVLIAGGSGDSYLVKAELKNAGGLKKSSSVKISGVPAGTVKSIEITDRDTVMAELELDDEAAPVGRDATLKVRPTDLLGERYGDLTPGDISRPAPDGTLIPLARTATPVELDDILNTFDADTRTRLGFLVNEAGTAMTGRSKDFAKLLRQMPAALDKTTDLVAEVAGENVRLKRLIEQGDRVTAAVNGRRDDLGELVEQASVSLKAVSDSRQELGATLANAPGGLRELTGTLQRVGSVADSLRPTADELRRSAGPLRETLDTLPAFATAARPALRQARESAPQIQRLGEDATAPVERVAPTARLLEKVMKDATPSIDMIDRRAMEDALVFVQNWVRSTNRRDALSHLLGAKAYVGLDTFRLALGSFLGGAPGFDPSKPPGTGSRDKRSAPKSAPPPASEPQAPKSAPAPEKPKPTLPDVTKEVPKVANDVTTGLQDLTDRLLPGVLREKQQQGSDSLRLLDYLLGS